MRKTHNIFSLFANGVSLLTDAFKPIKREEYNKNQYLIDVQKHLRDGFENAKVKAKVPKQS